MTILIQLGIFILVLSLLGLLFRAVFRLLVRLWLLPPLAWWGLCAKVYPQWSAAHPLIAYGVLAMLVLVMLAAWFGPLLENRRLERQVRDEIILANAEGRTIEGIRFENGVPVTTYRD